MVLQTKYSLSVEMLQKYCAVREVANLEDIKARLLQ